MDKEKAHQAEAGCAERSQKFIEQGNAFQHQRAGERSEPDGNLIERDGGKDRQMRTQEEQMNCLCWFIKYNCISNNNKK